MKEQLERRQKEMKKEDEYVSFLKKDRPKYASLGCGFHKGVYYFGTKLYKDGLSYDAVVTSKKKIYVDTLRRVEKDRYEGSNEIKYLFGLKYKFPFFDESLDHIFSKEAIYKWVYGDTEDITLKSVYEKLIKVYKKYVYFEDERKYSLLACYRIAGFFMPIWRARARQYLYAEMGSAKSRLTQINHNTGFNSIALGDWTLAYLKAIIESTRGETHIDDFETLPEEQKNATERLVKVGYMRGFKAGKMSEGRNRKPEVNDLFNTTTLNNTEGLSFITNDRCETIRIPKVSMKEYDEEPNFDNLIWKEIRDELYICGLKYAGSVKEVYDELKSDKIRGRLFFIFKPELTIAKLISKKVYDDLESFWIQENEQKQSIDYETDWEFLALKEIYSIKVSTSSTSPTSPTSSTSSTDYFSLLDDVVKPIGEVLYGEEEFNKKKRSMSTVIGNSLSRSPIFKKRVVKGKTQYSVGVYELTSLLEARGYLNIIEGMLKVDGVEEVDDVGGKMAIKTEEVVAE